ncbi:hypothetical protein NVP1081O_178 [Vibrio phage 1.081.O._10N.286.52.C2]|nr:hypothetical protein NVP1081O_178 [Vibrio phage 1.081.O._10N.286.52.C2]
MNIVEIVAAHERLRLAVLELANQRIESYEHAESFTMDEDHEWFLVKVYYLNRHLRNITVTFQSIEARMNK